MFPVTMAGEELPVKPQSVFKDVFTIRKTNQETVHARENGQETYELTRLFE